MTLSPPEISQEAHHVAAQAPRIPGAAHQAYRPDIDGMRAIAVILVVLGHAFPQYVPGGFIGVDIFFVISGYLITGIIQKDIGAGHFSIVQFYERRIRRIFPALILVLLTTFIAGWFLLSPSEFIALGKEIIAGAGFSANLLFYSEVGYFDAAAQSKPLLHLWSLGIEEQFYLVWPLLLLALARWRIAPTLPLTAILIASLVANIVIVGTNPEAAFYLPFPRAWELALGALIAIRPSNINLSDRMRDMVGWSGLAVIAAATAFYSSAIPYPGIAAVAPVAAAGALILTDGSSANRFLGNRYGVAVGLISYPLYLWHWPLLTMTAILKASFLRLAECGLVVGASFILAWLTFLCVERPIRYGHGKWRSVSLAGAMAATAALGGLTIIDGFAFRIPDAIREAGTLTVSRDFMRYNECHISASAKPVFQTSCVDAGKRPLIFVWGDSTAGMLAAGLRQIEDSQFGLAQFTVNSCPPVFTAPAAAIPFCVETNRRILAWVTTSHPDIVVLHAAWTDQDTAEDLRPTVTALRQAGIRDITLVGPVPYWNAPLPRLVLQYFNLHHRLMPERMRDHLVKKRPDEEFRKIAEALGIGYFSAWDALCNADGCLTRIGDAAGDLISADAVHLLPHGSRFLASKLVPELVGAAKHD
jgi:peptidoglycan/LPS O-acetylase OafA/YrhL